MADSHTDFIQNTMRALQQGYAQAYGLDPGKAQVYNESSNSSTDPSATPAANAAKGLNVPQTDPTALTQSMGQSLAPQAPPSMGNATLGTGMQAGSGMGESLAKAIQSFRSRGTGTTGSGETVGAYGSGGGGAPSDFASRFGAGSTFGSGSAGGFGDAGGGAPGDFASRFGDASNPSIGPGGGKSMNYGALASSVGQALGSLLGGYGQSQIDAGRAAAATQINVQPTPIVRIQPVNLTQMA